MTGERGFADLDLDNGGGVSKRSTTDGCDGAASLDALGSSSVPSTTIGVEDAPLSCDVLTSASAAGVDGAGERFVGCLLAPDLGELVARGRLALLDVGAPASLRFVRFFAALVVVVVVALLLLASLLSVALGAAAAGFGAAFLAAAVGAAAPLACGEKNAAIDACFFFCSHRVTTTDREIERE